MSKLQKELKDYDEVYWDFVEDSKITNIHHIVGHLNKLMGKIAEYTDTVDHGGKGDDTKMIKEVIPDLLQQGYRLANLFGVDAEIQHQERLDELKKRFSDKNEKK